MNARVWHILTGEYPPQAGGVGDYAAQVAAGLAAAGAEVHVWTSTTGTTTGPEGVTVHPVCGHWSPADLARLGRSLDAFPKPRQLLVQYTPNAWGYRGLNLVFCRWLRARRRVQGDLIRLMFHEVAYPWQLRDRPTRWLLAAGHRWMARILLSAASHVDVTTPAWERLLRSVAPGDRREVGWRPVPSNIPVVGDGEGVDEVRRRVAPRGETIVGSFSSFSELTGPLLAGVLPGLLRDRPDRVGLLIGQGGELWAPRVLGNGRLYATGRLGPAEVSAHLRACDLVVQPYPDGITTRRTTAMATLAHGVPLVTNAGHLTEPFWAESGALALADAVVGLGPAAEHLINDPVDRERVGACGRELYERRFALVRTVEAILCPALGVGS